VHEPVFPVETPGFETDDDDVMDHRRHRARSHRIRPRLGRRRRAVPHA
jgi:hypothetical protein